KGTGYTLGADYTKYIDDHVFVQPQVQYLVSQNEYKDKHLVAYINTGYTFKLDDGITVSPKAGLGVRHSTSVDSSDNGFAYNVGVDVGFAKNWTVGLQYN
ncbi:outer membrane beta-barrel protein, partial [Burkholderia cenocepacia]|uniref:outer membrane beta-barrel protein n=1 Tax=Burkholderia cenocepacia TaxID=95486 RepID=UPI0011780F26